MTGVFRRPWTERRQLYRPLRRRVGRRLPSGVTVVVESIGTGRDYETPQDWADAKDGLDLVALNELHVGQIYDDVASYGAVQIDNVTTDSSRYLVLEAAPGHEYDPITDTGVFLSASTGGYTVSAEVDFTEVRYLGAEYLGSGVNVGTFRSFASGTRNVAFVGCTGFMPNNTEENEGAVFATTPNTTFTFYVNCLAIGEGDQASGPSYGFFWPGSTSTPRHFGCGAYAIAKTGNSTGSHGFGGGSALNTVASNCWAFDCANSDFQNSGDYALLQTSASSDGTGTSGLQNLIVGDELIDPDNNDFRALSDGNLAEAATSQAGLGGQFVLDITRAVRIEPTEVGPYDGVVVAVSVDSSGTQVIGLDRVDQTADVAATPSGTTILESDRVDQTVGVGVEDSGAAALTADRVDRTVGVGISDAGTQVIPPGVDQQVVVGVISSGTQVLEPDRVDQVVDVDAEDSGAQILAPGVVQEGGAQSVSVGVTSTGTQVVAPERVDQTTGVGAIDSGTQVIESERIDQTVPVGAEDSGTAILAPDRVDQTVDVGAEDAGTVVLTPDRVDQAVDVAAESAGTQVVTPSIDQGGDQFISVGVVSSGTQVPAPDRVDQTVGVGAEDSGTDVVAPTVGREVQVGVAGDAQAASVAPGRVDRTVDVPAVDAGTVVLTPARIDQTVPVGAESAGTIILGPGVVFDQLVVVAFMASGTVVLAPVQDVVGTLEQASVTSQRLQPGTVTSQRIQAATVSRGATSAVS